MRVVETARRAAPRDFRWRTRALRVRPASGDRSADGLGPVSRDAGRGRRPRAGDRPARRGSARVSAAPRALPPLPGPPAGRRRLRRRAQRGQDDARRRAASRASRRAGLRRDVKHTSKDVEDDVPGKDSHRHAGGRRPVRVRHARPRTTARRFGAEEELSDVFSRASSPGATSSSSRDTSRSRFPGSRSRAPGSGASRSRESAARVSDAPSTDGVPTLPLPGIATASSTTVLARLRALGRSSALEARRLRPRRDADRRLRGDRGRARLRDDAPRPRAARGSRGSARWSAMGSSGSSSRPWARSAPPEGVRLFRQRYPEVAVAKTELMPGVPEVLATLEARGAGARRRLEQAARVLAPDSRGQGRGALLPGDRGPDAETPAKPDPAMLRARDGGRPAAGRRRSSSATWRWIRSSPARPAAASCSSRRLAHARGARGRRTPTRCSTTSASCRRGWSRPLGSGRATR